MALPWYRFSQRRLIALLVAGAVVALLAVATRSLLAPQTDVRGVSTGRGLYAYAKAQVMGDLLYPGAVLLQELGTGDTGGRSTEYAGAVFASTDTADDIYAWYVAYAQTSGWSPAEVPRASTQVSIRGYRRGQREAFYVALNNPRALAATLGRAVPEGQTLFETTFYVSPSP